LKCIALVPTCRDMSSKNASMNLTGPFLCSPDVENAAIGRTATKRSIQQRSFVNLITNKHVNPVESHVQRLLYLEATYLHSG